MKIVNTSRGPVLVRFPYDGFAEITRFDETGWDAETIGVEATPASEASPSDGPADVAELLVDMLGLDELEATQIAREVLAEYSARGGEWETSESSPTLGCILGIALTVLVVGLIAIGWIWAPSRNPWGRVYIGACTRARQLVSDAA